MHSLPILAVLLTVPAAVRDGAYQPVGGMPEGDRDAPPGDGARTETALTVEPEFARIPAVSAASEIALPAADQTDLAEPAIAQSTAIPEPDFGGYASGLELTPAGQYSAEFAQLEPAVLIRPVQGIDAALASASDAGSTPAFEPLPMPAAPTALALAPLPSPVDPAAAPLLPEMETRTAGQAMPVAEAALVDASSAEDSSVKTASGAHSLAASLAPPPKIAYQFSEVDRAAADFANRQQAGAPLAHAPRAEALAASTAAAVAEDAIDAPMPPRSSGGGAVEKTAFDGDFLIVAGGAVALPSYEGSDDTVISPAGGVAGRISGIGINARAAGIALDLVPDGDGAKLGIGLGPVVRYRTNRSGRIVDPVVASLGKLKGVIEAGVAASVTIKRLLSGHDQLTIGADVRWDISGRGSGYVVVPTISYLTPLSRAQVMGVLVSAEFADGRFAHYNYDVSAAGSLVSGLPAYSARGGLKAGNIGVFTARDLNGNLLDGGLVLGVGAMYGKLFGSAAETPLTSVRGRRSQWTFGAGLGYVF